MGKDPAVLFYPGDWIQGTVLMSFEERGAYIHLLCIQFSQGRMSETDIQKALDKDYERLWAEIKCKFKSDGTYYWNERMEEEKNKRRNFTESRRKNLQSKKNSKTHMDYHMENRNDNGNRNNFKKVEEPKKSNSGFKYITSGNHESDS